ncbi:MAG: inositol monophosphatase family protein [Paracoccaceae bacterium]
MPTHTSDATPDLPIPVPAPMTPAQRTQVLNLVRRAARSEILPRFRALSPNEIDTKSGPTDLVTEADRAAERMIARGLARMFPGARIIGEEAVSANAAILDGLAEAELAFTIDPVDGTWNYAHGLTQFGVILSVLRFGVPVYALLYDPIMDDSIEAMEHGPTQMLRRGRAPRDLRTGPTRPEADLQGYLSLQHVPGEALRARLAGLFPRFTRAMSLRCACHEMRMMAQGHADFLLTTGLTPWDHAAGVLAVQQAGGKAALLDGTPYRADAPRSAFLLAASTPELWDSLAETFGFLLEAGASK